MTAATSDLTSVASSPNLVSLLGSLVFRMWTAVLRLFEGFPSLPAGSTVNVRQSSLTIDVAGGTTVPAYWYFPADANPDRLIVLQHGFWPVLRCTATPPRPRAEHPQHRRHPVAEFELPGRRRCLDRR